MTNNKQSSVEYLIEQVKSKEWQDMFIWHKEEIFEQAKRMEKEQIIAARMNRMTDDELSYQTAEQYYNETYAENKTFKQNKFDPNFMHEWIRNKGMKPTKEKE